jgi:hypothetical protein
MRSVWLGPCKCTRCGKIRDEDHDWSEDCERCAVCGGTRVSAHNWQGCECSLCGETREEGHDRREDRERCTGEHHWCHGTSGDDKGCNLCLRCGATRTGEHSWRGCKCSICHETRNEGHGWSKDCEKCPRCGATQSGAHDWSKDCGKCGICKRMRADAHDWSKDSGKCARCGKTHADADRDAQLQHLIDVIKKSPSQASILSPEVEAVAELVKIGLAAVEQLHRVISCCDNHAARKWAVCALGEIGDVSCVGPLIDVLSEPFLDSDAESALTTIGMAAVGPLRRAIDDCNEGGVSAWVLTESAARVLRRIENHIPYPSECTVILHSAYRGSYRAGRSLFPKT